MDQFQYESLRINKDIRCFQVKYGQWSLDLPLKVYYFGVPESKSFGWERFKLLSSNVSGFKFYLGSDCFNLISAFSKSDYASKIETLSIGDSSFGFGNGRDYYKLIPILESADFSNLKYFELGVSELFHNSHCAFGAIGNISKLLLKMPNLERLSLSGAFELDSTICLPKLRELNVELDDCTTGINGGFISQQTFNNLLQSSYPSLKKAFIDIACENDDQMYEIPSLFLSAKNILELNEIELVGGFADTELSKVKTSVLYNKLKKSFIFENLAQES